VNLHRPTLRVGERFTSVGSCARALALTAASQGPTLLAACMLHFSFIYIICEL